MYYQIKSGIIYRDYHFFGYLTDNSNFGYKYLNETNDGPRGMVVSESGAVFLSALNWIPQSIDDILDNVLEKFPDVDSMQIKHDLTEFYDTLAKKGFVISGKNKNECHENNRISKHKQISIIDKTSNETSQIQDTSKYISQFFNDIPQLVSLHIEILSQCNERCIHCYIPHEKKTSVMSSEMFFDILEQARQMNILNVTLSGGEPLLHPNFIAFIRKCNLYNLSVNVLSNLTLLTQDIIDEMKKNPLLSVQTSLYSMDGEIHDSITHSHGSFEKTMSAILVLLENHIPVQISCPIMKQNMHCYKAVMQWGSQHNIRVNSDYVIIGRYDHSNDNLKCRLSGNDIRTLIEQDYINGSLTVQKVQNEIDQKGKFQPDDYICSVCTSSLCISEDGNVYPCAGWQDYILANINEYKLCDIWNNSPKIKYLRSLRRRDVPICLECENEEFCSMCMVRNANESPSGDPLQPSSFFCHVAKITKEIFIDKSNAT